jgi:putative Holliday junction resolvase
VGRILSIDLGERRVGLAVSDENQIIAQGLDTLSFKNEQDLIAKLKQIIQERMVSEIVIGNPISLSGKKTKRSIWVGVFQEKLKDVINIPINLFDERLTSQMSLRILSETYREPSRQKNAIDKIAATIILEDYLASKKRNCNL